MIYAKPSSYTVAQLDLLLAKFPYLGSMPLSERIHIYNMAQEEIAKFRPRLEQVNFDTTIEYNEVTYVPLNTIFTYMYRLSQVDLIRKRNLLYTLSTLDNIASNHYLLKNFSATQRYMLYNLAQQSIANIRNKFLSREYALDTSNLNREEPIEVKVNIELTGDWETRIAELIEPEHPGDWNEINTDEGLSLSLTYSTILRDILIREVELGMAIVPTLLLYQVIEPETPGDEVQPTSLEQALVMSLGLSCEMIVLSTNTYTKYISMNLTPTLTLKQASSSDTEKFVSMNLLYNFNIMDNTELVTESFISMSLTYSLIVVDDTALVSESLLSMELSPTLTIIDDTALISESSVSLGLSFDLEITSDIQLEKVASLGLSATTQVFTLVEIEEVISLELASSLEALGLGDLEEILEVGLQWNITIYAP
jgi:hypothetical protein